MRFGKTILSAAVAGVAALAMFVAPAMAQPTIKLAYTGQLSGPAAQVGDAEIKQIRYILDAINAKGGALGRPRHESVARTVPSTTSFSLGGETPASGETIAPE